MQTKDGKPPPDCKWRGLHAFLFSLFIRKAENRVIHTIRVPQKSPKLFQHIIILMLLLADVFFSVTDEKTAIYNRLLPI
jgi:hypothetical protein